MKTNAGRTGPCLAAAAVLATSAIVIGAAPASAATLTVCPNGCRYTQLAPAVAAAHDGDRITVGPGTYSGGVTIDVSVRLVGAGPRYTVISGGGPVLTVGVADAASEPTVTIDGVSVTGGAAIGNLTPWSGRGGGIYIPRAAGPSTGATVTVRNSVIRDNRTAPATAIESDDPCCPFADSGGGGISNDGTLTVDHTVISGNRADAGAGLASNTIGGGILNRAFGMLTVRDSVIRNNQSQVTPPNGRFAPGGGIAMVGGDLTMVDSVVSDNTSDTTSAVPIGVEQEATAGGIQVQGGASATIRGSVISGNSVRSVNTVGDAVAFSGGLHADGSLVLIDSTVSRNRVAAVTAPGSLGTANVDSGGGEFNSDATVRNVRIAGNSAAASSSAGPALAAAGGVLTAAFEQLAMTESVVRGNRVTATTTSGSAFAAAGGVMDIGVLTLHDTRVDHNGATAIGPDGSAKGGGIFVGSAPDGPPSPELTLVDSAVTHNTLTALPGSTTQGGGVFALFPVQLVNSVIARNVPDQCYGC